MLTQGFVTPFSVMPASQEADDTVVIGGKTLTLDEVIRVARYGAKVRLTDDAKILKRVDAACDYIMEAVKAGNPFMG